MSRIAIAAIAGFCAGWAVAGIMVGMARYETGFAAGVCTQHCKPHPQVAEMCDCHE